MEEAARLSKLSGEVDMKLGVLQERMKNLEKTATSLSTTFRKAEEARLSVPIPQPEVLAGALLEVPTHLGNLRYQVWEKMQPTMTYSPVTLDPNTAAHGLSVSDDLTGMIQHGNRGHAPDNPERFSEGSGFVLGAQVYLVGTHTWEVDLGDRDRWVLGVALQGASRSGQVEADEEHGFWTVALREGGRYVASTRPGTLLTTRPRKVVVVLDCVERSVAFHNADIKSLLFRFQGLSEGPLRAVFSPGGGDHFKTPLKILPTQTLGTSSNTKDAVKRLVRGFKCK
ncbi:hypothetical protein CRUP_026867 [Coryphaenoides rupestris]|nr:hypothetical protein CRUP_026867 [Coryphaenoides rupestris]